MATFQVSVRVGKESDQNVLPKTVTPATTLASFGLKGYAYNFNNVVRKIGSTMEELGITEGGVIQARLCVSAETNVARAERRMRAGTHVTSSLLNRRTAEINQNTKEEADRVIEQVNDNTNEEFYKMHMRVAENHKEVLAVVNKVTDAQAATNQSLDKLTAQFNGEAQSPDPTRPPNQQLKKLRLEQRAAQNQANDLKEQIKSEAKAKAKARGKAKAKAKGKPPVDDTVEAAETSGADGDAAEPAAAAVEAVDPVATGVENTSKTAAKEAPRRENTPWEAGSLNSVP